MNDPYGSGFDPITRHVVAMNEAQQLREAATRMLRESSAMLEEATTREARPRFSITRAINAAVSGSRQEAPEHAWSERIANGLQLPYSPAKPFVPWDAFTQRAMIAGTGSQGGYFVSEPRVAGDRHPEAVQHARETGRASFPRACR
jgi:hypothetical protein